jgi:ferrous iron transport protein A
MDCGSRIVNSSAMTHNAVALTLDQLPKNALGVITDVNTRDENADVSRRLLELGFVAGETVRVIAKGFFAGAPMAVRVGGTTFALRRFEAALISVSPTAALP